MTVRSSDAVRRVGWLGSPLIVQCSVSARTTPSMVESAVHVHSPSTATGGSGFATGSGATGGGGLVQLTCETTTQATTTKEAKGVAKRAGTNGLLAKVAMPVAGLRLVETLSPALARWPAEVCRLNEVGDCVVREFIRTFTATHFEVPLRVGAEATNRTAGGITKSVEQPSSLGELANVHPYASARTLRSRGRRASPRRCFPAKRHPATIPKRGRVRWLRVPRFVRHSSRLALVALVCLGQSASAENGRFEPTGASSVASSCR